MAEPAATARVTTESVLVRWLLTSVALLFLGAILIVPLVAVFAKALEGGWALYWRSITDPDAVAAIRLTLLTVLAAVPLNLLFGLAAAWSLAKFDFKGKSVLITLIDFLLLSRR